MLVTPKQFEAIELAKTMSQEEVGKRLGITRESANRLISRGRRAMEQAAQLCRHHRFCNAEFMLSKSQLSMN